MEIDNLIPVKSRVSLRSWLQDKSKSEKHCYVLVSMKPVPDVLLYLDAVEEALCFDGSMESERVRRLEKLGLMRDEG